MRKSFSLLLVLCMLLITGLYVVNAEDLSGEEEFSFDALMNPPTPPPPPRPPPPPPPPAPPPCPPPRPCPPPNPFTSRTAASKSP